MGSQQLAGSLDAPNSDTAPAWHSREAVAFEDAPDFLQALVAELAAGCSEEDVSPALAESLQLAFPQATCLSLQCSFVPGAGVAPRDGTNNGSSSSSSSSGSGGGVLVSIGDFRTQGRCTALLLPPGGSVAGAALAANSPVGSSVRVDRARRWCDLQYGAAALGTRCLVAVPVVVDPQGIVLPFLLQAARSGRHAKQPDAPLLDTYAQLTCVAPPAGVVSLGFGGEVGALDARHFTNLLLLAGAVAPSLKAAAGHVLGDLAALQALSGGGALPTCRLPGGAALPMLDFGAVPAPLDLAARSSSGGAAAAAAASGGADSGDGRNSSPAVAPAAAAVVGGGATVPGVPAGLGRCSLSCSDAGASEDASDADSATAASYSSGHYHHQQQQGDSGQSPPSPARRGSGGSCRPPGHPGEGGDDCDRSSAPISVASSSSCGSGDDDSGDEEGCAAPRSRGSRHRHRASLPDDGPASPTRAAAAAAEGIAARVAEEADARLGAATPEATTIASATSCSKWASAADPSAATATFEAAAPPPDPGAAGHETDSGGSSKLSAIGDSAAVPATMAGVATTAGPMDAHGGADGASGPEAAASAAARQWLAQHPWLLNFEEAREEEAYLQWRAAQLRLTDVVGGLALLWLLQAGAREPWGLLAARPGAWLAAAAYTLGCIYVFVARAAAWRRHRDSIAAASWLLQLALVACLGHMPPRAAEALPPGVAAGLQWAFFLSGAVPGLLWALCHMVTLRKFAVCQLASVLCFAFNFGAVCSHCAGPGGVRPCILRAVAALALLGIGVAGGVAYTYERLSRRAYAEHRAAQQQQRRQQHVGRSPRQWQAPPRGRAAATAAAAAGGHEHAD